MSSAPILNLIAIALLSVFAACSTPSGTVSMDNPKGGYLGVAPWYWTNGGALYATDGVNTYVMQHPTFPAGTIGGASVGHGESWVRVNGGATQGYYRSPATFRNQSIKPVFISY